MTCFANKDQFHSKGTPPVKKSTLKSGSETVSSSVEVENETPIVAQETAAECPRDVLSMILRDGAQEMLQEQSRSENLASVKHAR